MTIISHREINIDNLVDQLEEGAVIVYPTETCYGLGADATNDQAVERIFDIKKRQKTKSMLVIMPDVGMAMEYVEWNGTLERLSQRYWPGPLTLVAKLKKDHPPISPLLVADDGTIAFRVTDYPLAYEISASMNKPLVSTSANIASLESPYDIEVVKKMFEHEEKQPDLVIDAGELAHKSPSTIARVHKGNIEILRQGEIVIDADVSGS